MTAESLAGTSKLDLRGCEVPNEWLERVLATARDEELTVSVAATAATFEPGVRFDGLHFADRVRFDYATFGSSAHFGGSTFGRGAHFGYARFGPHASFGDGFWFDGATFGDRAWFEGALFGDDAWFGGVTVGEGDLGTFRVDGHIDFQRMRALGRVKLGWVGAGRSGRVSATFDYSSFLGPISMSGSGEVSLVSLDLSHPSMVRPAASALTVTSLEGANCRSLTLQDVDLTPCRLAGVLSLSEIGLAGAIGFATSSGWRTRRRVLAEEREPAVGTEGSNEHKKRLEAQYRGLRMALENAGDHAAAADFYYGELRHKLATARGFERVLLSTYRCVGGFGVRASRPFACLIGVVLVGALILAEGGLRSSGYPQPLEASLLYAVSLTGGTNAVRLSDAGFAAMMTVRVMGPVLIALTVVALRARVRR